MKTVDQQLRILWLSDIHYKAEYDKGNKLLDSYILSFLDFVKLLNDNDNFDYILISGDLTETGSEEDFKIFNKNLFTPLQEIIPNAKLLITPGNHDVFRKNAKTSIKKFVDSLPNKRETFFKENLSEFKKAFENYSNAFDIKKMNFPKSQSNLIDNNLLYGYVLDIQKKTLFILLNSAWYSVGSGLLEEYLEKVDIKDFKSKENIRNIRNIANEYGNQLLGLDIINGMENIISLIKDYDDFFIITSFHHPINWLNWNERINSNENKFHKIKNRIDLLLTGHEHVPRKHKPEKINDENTLHLQAGCFLDAQNIDKFKLFDNWFSTIEINIKKRTVSQTKYYYTEEDNKWNTDNTDEPLRKLKKMPYAKLSNHRKEKINLLNLDFKLLLSKENNGQEVSEIDNGYFLCDEKIFTNKKIEVDTFDLIHLKKLIDEYDSRYVFFVTIDLEYDIEDKYSTNLNRFEVLEQIKNDLDYKFDKLRHRFFSKLNTKKEVKKYKNLIFIHILKPFWEIEGLIKNV